jgi:hypothetical protein
MLQITCSCGRQLKAKDEFAGKKVRCPDCSGVLRVPELSVESQPPIAPEAPQQTMPEPLSFSCPNCGSGLKITDYSLIGKKVPCPKCKVPFQIAVRVEAAPVDVPVEPDEAEIWEETRLWKCPSCAKECQIPADEPAPIRCETCRANAPRPLPSHSKQAAKQNQPPKHRLWLAMPVIAALIAAPFMPAFPVWFGITILLLCVGAFIQTGADCVRLSERMGATKNLGQFGSRILAVLPVIQDFSRRVVRLNSSEYWRSGLRLTMYGLLGLILIVAGQTGAKSIAERERVVAKYVAEESERQRLATEANAKVASLVRHAETALKADNLSVTQDILDAASKTPHATDVAPVRALRTRLANAQVAVFLAEATKALNAGDIAAGKQKVRDALAVPNADALADATKLDQQIGNATDPTRIRAVITALSDEALQQLQQNGTMPAEMVTAHEALNRHAAELVKAEVERVVEVREKHRLAQMQQQLQTQLQAERKRQEEAQLAAEASHQAETINAICAYLEEDGHRTNPYRQLDGVPDEYYACSDYKDISPNSLNHIAYYVEGTRTKVSAINLDLNVHDLSGASAANGEMLASGKKLVQKATGKPLPNAALKAIMAGGSGAWQIGSATVRLTRDDYVTGRGYSLTLLIELK